MIKRTMLLTLFMVALVCAFVLPQKNVYAQGDGSKDDPYQIKDFASLAVFVNMTKIGQAVYGVLEKDITLSSNIHIGSEDKPFKGELDGNGHTLTYGNNMSDGLFIKIGPDATVKNLNIVYKNVVSDTGNIIGALTNINEGLISHCTTKGNNVGAVKLAGAIAGQNYGGTIEYCKATIDESVFTTGRGAHMAGGMVGENRGAVNNCVVDGKGTIYNKAFDVNGYSGGLVGGNNGFFDSSLPKGSVTSCIVEGSLKIKGGIIDWVGGIVGCAQKYSKGINDCLVYGDVYIEGAGNYPVGGICGYQESSIKNCFYNASGGIVGAIHCTTPIIGEHVSGATDNNLWNADKTDLNDPNGYGTEVKDIWWLKPVGKVMIPGEIADTDGLMRAGRSFYYTGRKVRLDYSGTIIAGQTVVYILNGERIDGNEVTMPKADSVIEAIVRQDINTSDLALSGNSFEYDGKAHNPTAQLGARPFVKDRDYTIEYRKGGETVTDCIDAGEYTATITGIGDTYGGKKNLGFTISKKSVEVSGIVPKNKEYDGNTSVEFECDDAELVGINEGDDIGVEAKGKFYDKNAGKNIQVEITELTLTGTDEGNYEVDFDNSQTIYTANISPKPATIETSMSPKAAGIEANNKIVYDGKEHYPTARVTNLVEGDECDVTIEITSPRGATSWKDANVAEFGDESALRYTAEISESTGLSNANYTIGENKEYSFYIKKKPITIKADDKEGSVAQKPVLTWSMEDEGKNWFESDKADIALVLKNDKGEAVNIDRAHAGVYTIVPSWNTENPNYNATFEEGRCILHVGQASRAGGILRSRVKAKGRKSLVISWNKIKGADGYDIFFARCDHVKNRTVLKKVKTVKGDRKCSWTKTGLRKNTAYKVYVKAYATETGKKIYVNKSPTVHAYTGNGTKKYTSAKAVTVKKSKVTLKKGKSFKIKAKVKKINEKKKLMPKIHAPKLRYLSSNEKIAIVSKSGKIKAKGKGACYVFVYAHNGVSKQVKVTVK